MTFRVDFKFLRRLRDVAACPVMALTATLTKRTKITIEERIWLKNPNFVVTTINRPNLYIWFLKQRQTHEVHHSFDVPNAYTFYSYSLGISSTCHGIPDFRKREDNNICQNKKCCHGHMGNLSFKVSRPSRNSSLIPNHRMRRQTERDFREGRKVLVIATVGFGMVLL